MKKNLVFRALLLGSALMFPVSQAMELGVFGDDEEELSFIQRHKGKLIAGGVLLLALISGGAAYHYKGTEIKKAVNDFLAEEKIAMTSEEAHYLLNYEKDVEEDKKEHKERLRQANIVIAREKKEEAKKEQEAKKNAVKSEGKNTAPVQQENKEKEQKPEENKQENSVKKEDSSVNNAQVKSENKTEEVK